ncbi:multiheme c-type cytochrome [Granulicella tundricola]|uniref:Cytochrome c-552/4 domain-containing protein n=1 Tax=Granulicella tundricola (strain ATCC BAA-1859 / DSM 23138 / MP5ACTX9) TaxID=1198114 RepID=E8X6W0_GRATM|nr:multiheme c-type cytochrome [Granulicella tundricola]ADW71260.1 hypothetical protein AciX9_3986 [Granulicella tundricola MP5ACTX9]
MKLLRKTGLLLYLACIFLTLWSARSAQPQQTLDLSAQTTTQERISSEVWWPTKPDMPMSAFAGSSSCKPCHQPGLAHTETSMQHAASTAAVTDFHAEKLTANSPPFKYSLTSSPSGIEFTASQGAHKLSHPLDWVMGAGDLGRTFLYQADGRWYQSRISYYTRPSALDITTGLSSTQATSLPTALGQLLSPEDARSCFGCHTVHATTSSGFNPLHAEAGLGCEACHGPTRAHVDAMHQQIHAPAHPASESAVFNPAKLSPSDSIDFCGSCHRSFADASLIIGPGQGTAVVRFQPYRLEESKCWRSTRDERLTCVACHDPHQPLERNTASYDRHCLQCHSTAAQKTQPPASTHTVSICPKASSGCITCHMPKVTVASMHGEFTDHFIRVVKPGASLPR